MPEVELIQDEIYHQCWGNIKSTVRTNINVPKDKLQTERQWAKQGYVVDRPTPEHTRGRQLWTNANCGAKCLYYFKAEVRKGSKKEIKAFFEPEREKRRASAKRCREQAKKEKQELENLKKEINILELINADLKKEIVNLNKKIDKYESIANVIPTLCKEIIKNTLPNNLNTASVIVIDTETTGLDCITDELLQVSIISDTRETLYNSYLRPLYHTVWTEAEKINGISPDMVKDSPTVLTECVKINDIVSQADVIIGYNQDFDLGFLANIGCDVKEDAVIIDVMKLFAEIYCEWSDYFGGYKWQKLTTCATYYGYEWEGNAHDSLADCLATLYCYEKMKNGEI